MARRTIGLSKFSGIYCFENKVNGKKYIGQAININKRVSNHFGKLDKNNDSEALQNAWNKYGEDNFSVYIIEECEKEYLSEREIFYIKEFGSKSPFGYNLTDGGEAPSGCKHSEEFKEEKRKRWLGENNPNFGKFGKDHPLGGVPKSEEVKAKIGASNKGKLVSDETRQKQRLSHIGKNSGENSHFYGQHKNGESNHNFGTKKENSSSKYFGVYIQKQRGYIYWQASLSVSGNRISLGSYKEETDAAIAYDNYIVENNLPNHLNFPENYN